MWEEESVMELAEAWVADTAHNKVRFLNTIHVYKYIKNHTLVGLLVGFGVGSGVGNGVGTGVGGCTENG